MTVSALLLAGIGADASGHLYPECGCPPVRGAVTNVCCRNADCIDYGTHRRALMGDAYGNDRCGWCGAEYTLLTDDVFRGAR